MSEAISLGMESNPLEGIKSFKANAKLHKPIENVSLLLEEIRLIIFSVAAQNHITLAVSLTYLRGLEVSELEESDMPMV